MSTNKRVRLIVRGYVQGVGFRWFTVRTAKRLALTGWVRNNSDGSVETVAEGPENSINTFIKELRIGPMSANVKDIDILREDFTGKFTTFSLTHA